MVCSQSKTLLHTVGKKVEIELTVRDAKGKAKDTIKALGITLDSNMVWIYS